MAEIYSIYASDGLDDQIECTMFCRTYKECAEVKNEILDGCKTTGESAPEIRIDRITLAKLPLAELAVALANRQGYAAKSEQVWPKPVKAEPLHGGGANGGHGGGPGT